LRAHSGCGCERPRAPQRARSGGFGIWWPHPLPRAAPDCSSARRRNLSTEKCGPGGSAVLRSREARSALKRIPRVAKIQTAGSAGEQKESDSRSALGWCP
jgi:hypothetical protein